AHPTIDVRQEYIAGLSGQYNTKMRQQAISRTLPDVALIQLGPFHELADHFAEVPKGIVNDSEAGSLDATGLAAFQHHGKQRGLPVSGGNLLIYANPECFARAARLRGETVPVPDEAWTMADFHRTAKRLTCDFDGDGVIDQFGFWLPRWVYYLPFVWSFGAEIAGDGSADWKLNGPAAERAFSFYQRLAVTDRVSPRDEEVPQMFQDVAFLTGKVAMCVNGPWFMPFLEQTKLADSYLVVPIPQFEGRRRTRITWDGAVMAKNLPRERRLAGTKLLAFLISKRVQERIARSGRALPARTDCMTSFAGSPPDARRSRFVEALSYSRLQPRFDRFTEVDRVINRYLVDLTHPSGTTTPKQMLDRLGRDAMIRSVLRSATP
ncbi:MAG: extracellular solute-binding protein, partial [Planctomycetes bacterium]|nr:extracellular solute-binding protein [Planctomycetota bacterium]